MDTPERQTFECILIFLPYNEPVVYAKINPPGLTRRVSIKRCPQNSAQSDAESGVAINRTNRLARGNTKHGQRSQSALHNRNLADLGFAILSGPVSCTEVPPESTATVTGMSTTSNS